MVEVEVECGACGATGIYHGFAEPEGVGVVCSRCKGKGKIKISYTPFTGRKIRSDIKKVRLSKGSFIGTGIGPVGEEISYEEFFNGKMPTK